MSTRTRFEKEAKGNSEMAYSLALLFPVIKPSEDFQFVEYSRGLYVR